jgi:hypothetical protein
MRPQLSKTSILGPPLQGIQLDAAAVSDAATYDGETLFKTDLPSLDSSRGF